MKQLEQFQCEICNTVYNNKIDCEKCEKGHVKPVKIVDFKFNSVKNDGKYPKTITVELSNGEVKIYKA